MYLIVSVVISVVIVVEWELGILLVENISLRLNFWYIKIWIGILIIWVNIIVIIDVINGVFVNIDIKFFLLKSLFLFYYNEFIKNFF